MNTKDGLCQVVLQICTQVNCIIIKSSSSYNSGGNTTQINLSNAANNPITLSGTFTSFARATQELNQLYLIAQNQLAPATVASLNGTSVAMAIALGG